MNNREFSLVFWIITLLLISLLNKEVRKSIVSLLKAMFQANLSLLYFLYLVYLIPIYFFLNKFEYWSYKDVVFWTVLVGFSQMYRSSQITSTGHFKSSIYGAFKFTALFEFFVNIQVFNICVELLLTPLMTLLILLFEVSKSKKEYKIINKILNFTLAVLGFSILIYHLFNLLNSPQLYININTFKAFHLPLLLTVLTLPFFYFFAVFCRYEYLFARIKAGTIQNQKTKGVNWIIFKHAKLNLEKIGLIEKKFNKSCFYQKESIDSYVKKIISHQST